MSSILSGTYAGFIATGPMTMWMLEWERSLPKALRSPLPPATLSYQSVRRATGTPGKGVVKTGGAQSSLTMVAHFGYGAAVGAVYGLIADSMAPQSAVKTLSIGRTMARGTAFGLAVWGLNYLGVSPALGYRAAAPRMSGTRSLLMVTAHLIWGVALARTHAVLSETGKMVLEGERKASRAE